MVDDSVQRVRELLREAQLLVGEGEVQLEVVSAPVVEWVYVGLEYELVVVSDKGGTRTFGVSLVDDSHRNDRGGRGRKLEAPASCWTGRIGRRRCPGRRSCS